MVNNPPNQQTVQSPLTSNYWKKNI